MVERTVCSTGEETDGNSLKAASVVPSVPNDGFATLGAVDGENEQPIQGHPVLLEPEVGSTFDGSKLDRSRGSAGSGASGATGRFSLLKWFKRGSRESASSDRVPPRKASGSPGEEPDERGVSSSSSTESVETFYSTATVRSFAFRSGTLERSDARRINEAGRTSIDLVDHDQRKVGPFGVGAAKLVAKKESRREALPADVARTLPASVLSRRRDITARYSLQPCSGFGSCGNFAGSQRGLSGSLRRLDERGTGRRVHVHVRGKRRAPNPPGSTARPKAAAGPEETKTPRGSARRKRRPAPRPPERSSAPSSSGVEKEEAEEVEPGMEAGEAGVRENISASETSKEATCLVGEAEFEARKKVGSRSAVAVADLVAAWEAPKNPETVDDPGLRNTEGEDGEDSDLTRSIGKDTLVLRGGVWHWKKEANSVATVPTGQPAKEPTPGVKPAKASVTTGSQTSAMPRPWYKRSVFEHSRDSGTSKRGDVLRNPTALELREDQTAASPAASSSPKAPQVEKPHSETGGSLSRLSFFNRAERNSEERRRENKRKSGLSILTNISELDKEAAAIVQEEQARTRAAMIVQASRTNDRERLTDQVTEDVVQDMVNSAIESSPRRGTRALISKFNAIGNITRVTVNSSFFSRSSYARDRREERIEAGNSRPSASDEPRDRSGKFQASPKSEPKVDKDLSRYFMPQQRSPKNPTDDKEAEASPRDSPRNRRAAADASARLSFLRGNAAGTKSPGCGGTSATSAETKISRPNDEVVARDESGASNARSKESSPKLSRLRVRVINSEVPKTIRDEADDEKRVSTDEAMKKKKRSLEVMQNEFSCIFNEIDRQLASRDFRGIGEARDNKLERKSEPGTSSQVSRVLDILVEAEKGDRQKFDWSRANRESEVSMVSQDGSDTKMKNLEPVRTDLKEMLKEMKHSLPKRPKAKRGAANTPKVSAGSETREIEEAKTEVKIGPTEEKSRESYLLNSVTVVYPPPIRIGPPAAARPNPAVPEERDYDRQKVSSAAQTCGNVRKVTREIGGTPASSAKWRNEDVVYKTSGKGVATAGTSGLVKNTFQLIRPREFAQIEAIKTMKGQPRVGENTYANVIGQSLYANASVPAPKKVPRGLPAGASRREEIGKEAKVASVEEKKSHGGSNASTASSETNGEAQDGRNAVDQQNMNTLAVNRLLRKLEAAIASGHHQQAAGLAKELARLKIHCSVVRQRTKAKDVVNVNMYIEDKLAHQGPIPLRLARSMTVAQLKAKVFTEFEIPTNVQRWIVGKNLADDDATTLEELQAVEGSPVFLYLVAPELKNEYPPGRVEAPAAEEGTRKDPEPVEEIATVPEIEEREEEGDEDLRAEPQTIKEEDEEECISEEVRMERYEALISLENCDVIPNSEPIECPICFVTYGPQEGVILRDCLHMFCRTCIANTIRYCEEAEVKCPFRNTEYTCESTLQEREIKALVETEIYQQHLAKSIAQAENNAGNNAFHCKTPDCPGWCIYDDNVNNFLCPVCGVNNCLTCQVAHTGKNCRQYQQELRLSKETDQESKRTAAMLEEMVDRGEALPCPTCAVVLMKKWGCDWLRCSMCKTEICWVTRGPRWGPGGKGDTSGGCRCGENGVKCHPRCNYCH